ncbi:MAG: amino acid adenylation domain-containing protein, partial [Cyclobacteriaceae bacterium]
DFTFEKIGKDKDPEEYIREVKSADRQRGFDLSNGSQVRLHVIEISNGQYELIWAYHHILIDGWCMSVLITDFDELLRAEVGGVEANLPAVVPYSGYINWLKSVNKEDSNRYWKEYLDGYSEIATIPFKYGKDEVSYDEANEYIYIEGSLLEKIKSLCGNLGITLNTYFQGIWGYLLSKYNQTDDVIFGSVVSGRPPELQGIENMIGLFINTIPVRVRFTTDDTPSSLLKSLQEQSIQGSSYHYLSLTETTSHVDLGADMINHLLIYDNYPQKEFSAKDQYVEENTGLTLESTETVEENNYPLNITIIPKEGVLSIDFRYNANLFDGRYLERVKVHFENLIHQFLEHENTQLNELVYLSEEEKHEQLNVFSHREKSYFLKKNVLELFEEQVRQTPDSQALIKSGTSYTYEELNRVSNQLAHCLISNYAIKPKALVGFKLLRDEWSVITMLAILKTGAAYVPIDPDNPPVRRQGILNDSQIELLVTITNFLFDEEAFEEQVFALDVEFEAEDYPSTKPEINLSTSDRAYVIYTSGSTGKPKGVMISHASLVNYLQWGLSKYSDHSQPIHFGLFTSLAFDLTVTSIYLPIISGGTLTIFDSVSDISETLRSYFTSNITHIKLTPEHINLLDRLDIDSTTLKVAIVGGDKLVQHHIKVLHRLNSAIKIYNEYGPTESTVGCSVKEISQNYEPISIGKSIANTQIYILNDELDLLPIGIVGEICVSGAGLAEGYLRKKELTKEKFIDHPFIAGDRLYLTGDLGRWLPDGNIDFIGRKDNQVKIKSHRVELGEIDHLLSQNDQIEQTTVLARKNKSGEQELVAYVVARTEQNTNDLRASLKNTLPEYMLPTHFVQLDELPLTSNGKVDKLALPDPEGLALGSGVEYVPPSTDSEKVLVKVWEGVLKRVNIGIEDSFYNLGGDSIKSIQVVARLKQQGYSLKVEHLLRTPVLKELAALMVQTVQVTDQNEVSGAVLLTPIQEWFFDEIKVMRHFNQSILLSSREEIDGNILAKSIDELTRHHDALRMVYHQKDDGWHQFNLDTEGTNYLLDFHDLREEENELDRMAEIGESLQSGADLSEGPLLRAVHFRTKSGDKLGLIIHHLVVDGVSWRILLEDLSALYSGYKSGNEVKLPLKTDSYQKWALLLKEYANSRQLENERSYWQTISSQDIPELPQDKDTKGIAVAIDSAYSFRLD